MTAQQFAEWLAALLDEPQFRVWRSEDSQLRIVITDGAGKAAEVTFDGEWTWETIGNHFVLPKGKSL